MIGVFQINGSFCSWGTATKGRFNQTNTPRYDFGLSCITTYETVRPVIGLSFKRFTVMFRDERGASIEPAIGLI